MCFDTDDNESKLNYFVHTINYNFCLNKLNYQLFSRVDILLLQIYTN